MNHGAATVAGKDCAACHARRREGLRRRVEQVGLVPRRGGEPGDLPRVPRPDQRRRLRRRHQQQPAAGADQLQHVTIAPATATGVAAGTPDQIATPTSTSPATTATSATPRRAPRRQPGIQGKEWAQAKLPRELHRRQPAGDERHDRPLQQLPPEREAGGRPSPRRITAASPPRRGRRTAAPATPSPAPAPSRRRTGSARRGHAAVHLRRRLHRPAAARARRPTTQPGITNLPHPTLTGGRHPAPPATPAARGGKNAIGYDHASTLISANCGSCHEAGSNLVGTAVGTARPRRAPAPATRGRTRCLSPPAARAVRAWAAAPTVTRTAAPTAPRTGSPPAPTAAPATPPRAAWPSRGRAPTTRRPGSSRTPARTAAARRPARSAIPAAAPDSQLALRKQLTNPHHTPRRHERHHPHRGNDGGLHRALCGDVAP